MKLKTFARRAAAAGAVLAALTLAALPALAAPKVQVSTTNAVADHADILSDETEQYVNDVSIKLSDACGAQIGVYTLDELLGSTTMEGFAYDVFNAWGLGSDDLDNGVLLLLAPNEADGGDYYIMRGDGLESQLSFSTLGSLLDDLGNALTGPERDAARARDIIRSFITKISVVPLEVEGREDGRGVGPVRITVEGSLTQLLDQASADRMIQRRESTSATLGLPNVPFSFYADITKEDADTVGGV